MKYTFPLKKTVGWTALTSLEDCAAASTAMGDVLSIVNVWFVGSGEGLPSPLHWKVSRPTLDHHLNGGGLGQLSPRSPSVADQLVKVQFEKLNVEYGNLQVQCPKSDVGSENLKDKC